METMSLYACVGFLLAEYIWYCRLIYRTKTTFTCHLFFGGTAQTSCQCQFDLGLYISNEIHNSNLLSETMAKTPHVAFGYSFLSVILFGIVGNILVAISILRKKSLLKNNYYFLVLQLAICDLGALIIHLKGVIEYLWAAGLSYRHRTISCVFSSTFFFFFAAGLGMMLVISVLRYRATVHPLKLAITRRKLKVVCGLVHVAGLIAVYGTILPPCCIQQNLTAYKRYYKFAYEVIATGLAPTIFMAVVYYKIGRALAKQNKQMKRVCSNAVRKRHIRDRRIFLVCISTVLCCAVGKLPIWVWQIWYVADENFLSTEYSQWFRYYGVIMAAAGTQSINPLMYGVFDKKMFTFWKLCCKKIRIKTIGRAQEN